MNIVLRMVCLVVGESIIRLNLGQQIINHIGQLKSSNHNGGEVTFKFISFSRKMGDGCRNEELNG